MAKLDTIIQRVRLKNLYTFSMTRQAPVDEKGRIFWPGDFNRAFPYKDPVLYRHRTQPTILVFRQETLSDELLKRLRKSCAESYAIKIEGGKVNLPAEFQVKAFGVNKSSNSKVMLIGQRSFFEMRSKASLDEIANKIPEDIPCLRAALERDNEIVDVVDAHINNEGRIWLRENLFRQIGQTDQFLVVQGQTRKAALFLTENHLPLNDPAQLTSLARHSCAVELDYSQRLNLPQEFAMSALRMPKKENSDVKIVVYKKRFEMWSPEEWDKHTASHGQPLEQAI